MLVNMKGILYETLVKIKTGLLLLFFISQSLCGIYQSRGHDRMVVGFTTTCVISAYHH
jgi:hypothetical protein